MSIAPYKRRLDELKKHLNTRIGMRQQLETDVTNLTEDIGNLRGLLKGYDQVRILLQKTSETARETAKAKLEEIVTSALQYVFGQDFKFEIELSEVRGRPEAEFYVVSPIGGEMVRTKPEDSRGGGVVDIIALALRVAVLQIHSNPRMNGPLILDEPGKHVSEDYAVKLASFLVEVAKLFKRQALLVTHQPYIAEVADNRLNVELRGGESVVLELEVE